MNMALLPLPVVHLHRVTAGCAGATRTLDAGNYTSYYCQYGFGKHCKGKYIALAVFQVTAPSAITQRHLTFGYNKRIFGYFRFLKCLHFCIYKKATNEYYTYRFIGTDKPTTCKRPRCKRTCGHCYQQ